MGLKKEDLYYKSFDEYISNSTEIKSLNSEIQKFKYSKYEENRLKLIEEVQNLRRELKSRKNISLKKSHSSSYILDHGKKLINNEKMRYQFFENQQLGLMLNIIDREYKRDELEKKLAFQDQLAKEREIEIKKMREREKIEHDERDRLQKIKMEERELKIKNELLQRAKKRDEEDRKLMIKNELRKLAEERERKERQQEMKAKEELFKKKIEYLYSLRLKRRQKIEKQIIRKGEIQKKNLEEIRLQRDKELKEKIRETDQRIKRAIHIIKIRNAERDKKNARYYNEKTQIIKQQLELKKEQEKSLMRERLIHTAIKREEVEFNLKKKEELFKRNRLKLLYEINEKDKKITLAKSQKLKIWEEQRKISKNFEENREKLITKFKEIMNKRRKKSKEQVVSELLNKKMEIKTLDNSHIKENTLSIRNLKKKGGYKNNRDDHTFLTNLSMRQIKNYRYKINDD